VVLLRPTDDKPIDPVFDAGLDHTKEDFADSEREGGNRLTGAPGARCER